MFSFLSPFVVFRFINKILQEICHRKKKKITNRTSFGLIKSNLSDRCSVSERQDDKKTTCEYLIAQPMSFAFDDKVNYRDQLSRLLWYYAYCTQGKKRLRLVYEYFPLTEWVFLR